ncbi:MAG: hypothetical protein FD152_3802, partial [Xanthobacteraceae bacterium]
MARVAFTGGVLVGSAGPLRDEGLAHHPGKGPDGGAGDAAEAVAAA